MFILPSAKDIYFFHVAFVGVPFFQTVNSRMDPAAWYPPWEPFGLTKGLKPAVSFW